MSPLPKCKFRTIELPGLPPIELSFVKGGASAFGSERKESSINEIPVHVAVMTDFWMMCCPVSQALYQATMAKNSSRFVHQRRPVDIVGWEDLVEFISSLNKLYSEAYSKESESTFHLPSEHQWEYAARGGIYRPSHDNERYSGSDELAEVGWHIENNYDCTMPIGLKRPNQLGLYDMSGNVDELCIDSWQKSIYLRLRRRPVTDPVSNRINDSRVIRGGSWISKVNECRSASRRWRQTDWRLFSQGFRLVLSWRRY